MMTTSQSNPSPRSKKVLQWLLTLVLWLATIALGFLAFVALQNIATTAISFALKDSFKFDQTEMRGWITTTRNLSTILGGIVWLGLVVGGMEYHFRHVGKRRSLRVFAWTLGIEIALVLLNFVFVFLVDVVF